MVDLTQNHYFQQIQVESRDFSAGPARCGRLRTFRSQPRAAANLGAACATG
jgi:hypothetical protein